MIIVFSISVCSMSFETAVSFTGIVILIKQLLQ